MQLWKSPFISFLSHWLLICVYECPSVSGLIWSSWSNRIRQLGMCYANLQPASLLQAISRKKGRRKGKNN